MTVYKCNVCCVSCLAKIFVFLSFVSVILTDETGKRCKHNGTHELPEVIPVSMNETKSSVWATLLFSNCNVDVKFDCKASYPIEWVEIYNENIEELTDVQHNIRKNLWVDRIIDETILQTSSSASIFNSSITKYTAFLGLNFSSCAAANYSCRSVNQPCLQSNIISLVDLSANTIKYKYSSRPLESIRNIDKPCEATITVSTTKQKGNPGWKCTINQSLEYEAKSKTCDQAVNCNTNFLYQKQKCVKRLSPGEQCLSCRHIDLSKGFHPGFIYCDDENNKTLTALQYFFSIPQTTNKSVYPELYLDWMEADPQKMLYLEPIEEKIFVGQTVAIFCRVSRYYFAYGHRFGLEYENGTMHYTPSIDGKHLFIHNANRMNITVVIEEALKRIYCFAPVWNSTTWINQSMEVLAHKDAMLPTINLENDGDITYALDQRNVTLTCKADGRPEPDVQWISENKDTAIAAKMIEVHPGRKDLVFPYISLSTRGLYKCVATNFLGSTSKNVNLIVRDKFAHFVQFAVTFGFILIASFLLVLSLCWKKIRFQRRLLRALTYAEIREFREGNLEVLRANDYLEDIYTDELLYALPYNDEFEIPKDRLIIDTSVLLGSGHFGQVVKGLLSDGNDRRNSIEVAVKTVKPKYNVLYFKTLLSEVKIMAYIGRHVNVVSLVGACTKNIRKREIYIAVEFCEKGSLEMYLKRCRSTFVNLVCDDTIYISTSFGNAINAYENLQLIQEKSDVDNYVTTVHLVKWSREIANGMEFLGSKKIVHGDLASRNILLTSNLVAKIGDFGLSRQLEYSNYIRSNETESVLPWKWLAFEALKDMKFSVMSDVWSYGITLWEIFTLAEVPYPGVTWSSSFVGHLKNGLRLHKPSYGNSPIYNLMLECWLLEPMHRPTFTDLKDFFEGLLLQTCNDDYLDTSSTFKKDYINQANSIQVNNPSYSVLQTLRYIPVINGSHARVPKCHTKPEHVKFVSGNNENIVTAEEDAQGYLRPLLLEGIEEG